MERLSILKRRLQRFSEMRNRLEEKHKGKENTLTYYAGYQLGYIRGKIDQIENEIEQIELK